jgi:organic hydroperoxide reductase OsmC/OhrA
VLENVEGKYRFTEVILHPHVTVKSQEDIERAREVLDSAHKGCLVSNSITATVKVFPDFRVA